jgi:hypothetical protein
VYRVWLHPAFAPCGAPRDVKYGKIHESLKPFDGEFPKHHVLRVRDLFDGRGKRFRGGEPWLRRKTESGERIRSPHYAEWCKWMTILHKPWTTDPWTSGDLWGEDGKDMGAPRRVEHVTSTLACRTHVSSMTEEQQDAMYIAGWEDFVNTDERGFMIQQTLDRERADRLAVRDSLLNDDEYRRRDFGSRLMTTMGKSNAGARTCVCISVSLDSAVCLARRCVHEQHGPVVRGQRNHAAAAEAPQGREEAAGAESSGLESRRSGAGGHVREEDERQQGQPAVD